MAQNTPLPPPPIKTPVLQGECVCHTWAQWFDLLYRMSGDSSTLLTANAPLTFDNYTRVLDIPMAAAVVDGYLSSNDWNTFNDKENFLAAGTVSQYYRGDKTWATLDVSTIGAEPTITAGTSAQYWRGDKTWQTLNQAAVAGLTTASSPVFTGLTLSGLTASSMIYSGATSAITSTAAPTNGQLLIGSTGAVPTLGAITGTANRVTVTLGAGTISLTAPQDIHTSASPSFLTIKLSTLTDTFIPYHVSDATGLANSFMSTNGTDFAIDSLGAPTFNAALSIYKAGEQLRLNQDSTGTHFMGITVANDSSATFELNDAAGHYEFPHTMMIGLTSAPIAGSVLEVYSGTASTVMTITAQGAATGGAAQVNFKTGWASGDFAPWQVKGAIGHDGSNVCIRSGDGTLSNAQFIFGTSSLGITALTDTTTVDPYISFRHGATPTIHSVWGYDHSDSAQKLRVYDGTVGESLSTGQFVFTSTGLLISGGAPLTLKNNGTIEWQGVTGGWINSFNNLGSTGTQLFQFGFKGSSNTFDYFYIGTDWSTPTAKFYTTATASNYLNESQFLYDVRIGQNSAGNGHRLILHAMDDAANTITQSAIQIWDAAGAYEGAYGWTLGFNTSVSGNLTLRNVFNSVSADYMTFKWNNSGVWVNQKLYVDHIGEVTSSHGIVCDNSLGIGTTPGATIHALSTTEQLRLGYDAGSYMSVTVANGSATVFDLAESATFRFSKNVGVNCVPESVFHANSGTTNTNAIFECDDGGASAGPIVTLRRFSASPAVNDYIGQLVFEGKDSTAETTIYGQIDVKLLNITNTTEAAKMEFTLMDGGSPNLAMWINSDGQINADLGGGDGHVTVFDDYDDAKEIQRVIKDIDYERGVQMGVFTKAPDGGYMMCMQKFAFLLAGGIYQMNERLKMLEAKLA